MNSLVVAVLALMSTSANAQVPDNSIIVGGMTDIPSIFDITGAPVPNSSNLGVTDGATPKAFAIGPNETLWAMHCGYNAIIGYPNDGSPVALFNIPSLCTTYVDLENTDDGTLLLAANSGGVFELDPTTGALTPLGGVNIDDTELVQSISYADGRLAFGIHSPFDPKEVVVLEYPSMNVDSTLTFANQPNEALLLLNRTEAIVSNSTFSLITEHTVSRHNELGAVWSVGISAPAVDIVLAEPDVLWVLQDNGSVVRLRASDGLSFEDADFMTNVLGGATPTAMEIIDWGVGVVERDDCPTNPTKTEPGVCGCDYEDVPVVNDRVSGTGCVHITAQFDPAANIRNGAYVHAYAQVDAGATIHENATVGTRAHVGADSNIGDSAVIGRESVVGDRVIVGINTVVGRAVTIGDDASTNAFSTIGYGVTIAAGADFASSSIIGNHVTMLPGTYSIGLGGRGTNAAVIGRGVTFQGSATVANDVTIGPNTTLGAFLTVGAGTRFRKGVTVGPSQTIGQNVRVGRYAQLNGNGIIRDDVTIGPSVTVLIDQCLDDGTTIGRGLTVGDLLCTL